MKARCLNPNASSYPNYGGRGITVCDRWRDSFEAFFADMGPRPSPEHSIERLDVNGGYNKQNCVWGTRLQQGNNRRPTSEWKGMPGTRPTPGAIRGLAATRRILMYVFWTESVPSAGVAQALLNEASPTKASAATKHIVGPLLGTEGSCTNKRGRAVGKIDMPCPEQLYDQAKALRTRAASCRARAVYELKAAERMDTRADDIEERKGFQ